MAILKIARMGHPVLRTPARPVADASAPELPRLVRDMVETMYDAGGTGLAAPQVHVPLRLVVYLVSAERASRADADAGPDDGAVPLTVLINPELEPLGEACDEGWEGCLSVPGLAGLVPRYRAVRYRARGLDGQPLEGEAHGFHARVLQHECDHLDGLLYLQRMRDLTSLTFTDQPAAADAGAAARAALAELAVGPLPGAAPRPAPEEQP